MAGENFIALESTSQEIKTAVEGVKTDVAGVNTDVDGVKNDTENIISQLSGGSGVIRHIQRGTFSMPYDTENIKITLSGFTNIDKMIVILNSYRTNTGNCVYLKSLTLNSLTIQSNDDNTYGSYQVIESY